MGSKSSKNQAPPPPPPSAPVPTFEETLKENTKRLDRAIRSLNIERNKLEIESKKLEREIRTMAQKGNRKAAVYAAKDLARTRANIERTFAMQGQLRDVKGKLSTARTQQVMMSTLSDAGRMLAKENQGMNVAAMQKVVEEFMTQSEAMEIISETMDDAMETTGTEYDAEAEAILNEVLDEQDIDNQQRHSQATPQGLGADALATPPETLPQAALPDISH